MPLAQAVTLPGSVPPLRGIGSSPSLPLTSPSDLIFPNWYPTLIVGLALSVGLVAISWMLGEAIGLPSVKAFARKEIYELGVSVILVVLILSSLYAFGVFAGNVAASPLVKDGRTVGLGRCMDTAHIYPLGSANPENALYALDDYFLGCMPLTPAGTLPYGRVAGVNDPRTVGYDAEKSQLDMVWDTRSRGIMAGHLFNMYISLFTLEAMLGPVSTFGMSFYLPQPLVSDISLDMAPNAGLTPVSEAAIMLTDLIGVGLGTIFLQKLLLEFFHQNALTVFLPLGLAFRAVPFLRKTGSSIIAAALVMYFIFPLAIWINSQLYLSFIATDPPVLIDWVRYESLMQMCAPRPGETALELQQRVNGLAEPYLKEEAQQVVRDLRNSLSAPDSDVGRPVDQISALVSSAGSNLGIVAKYLFNLGFAAGPSLPADYFFSAIVDMCTTGMQYFALSLLFLVNVILICVTLFRDISLAIGGEPRIFGMSKLV